MACGARVTHTTVARATHVVGPAGAACGPLGARRTQPMTEAVTLRGNGDGSGAKTVFSVEEALRLIVSQVRVGPVLRRALAEEAVVFEEGDRVRVVLPRFNLVFWVDPVTGYVSVSPWCGGGGV